MCRPGQTIDLITLQPHLERMQKLSLLLSKEVGFRRIVHKHRGELIVSAIIQFVSHR